MKIRSLPRLLLPVLIALSGCGGVHRSDAPPNLILISVDTLRRDHLTCYGYGRGTTPRIDRIAARGVLFENCSSVSSWTLPSHASMLTGLYPAFHGLQNDGEKLPTSVGTLAESLRGAGYFTLAVISHVYVSSEFGLDRGFDRFEDSLIERGAENPTADRVVDKAIGMFAQLEEEPYFAFLHFFDPHWDYTPPRPYDKKFTDPRYRGPIDGTLDSMMPYLAGENPMPAEDLRQAIALYDGEIAFVDAQIGRLLDWLRKRGRMENTVVALTADHGEEFLDHGRLGHGKSLFAEQIRVPLLIAGGGRFKKGTRRTDLVSLIDIAPTLLELAGAAPPEGLQGISLLREDRPEERVLFGESIRFGNEMRTALDGRSKVIRYYQGDGVHYYDIEKDPHERIPLPHDPSGGVLSGRLDEYGQVADRGWHLKLIAPRLEELRCRGRVTVEGKIVRPRKYFSANIGGPSRTDFGRFELENDDRTLSFDATILLMIGEIAFETVPPSAPVVFEIETSSDEAGAGVFLGTGEKVEAEGPFRLTRDDPRVRGLPRDYTKVPSGCYIRTVLPPRGAGASDLTEEAIERLRALGYVEE